MTKSGWTDCIQVTFTYEGIDFTCNSSILVGKDGRPVDVSIFDIKPVDEGLKQSAKEAALKTLETQKEK